MKRNNILGAFILTCVLTLSMTIPSFTATAQDHVLTSEKNSNLDAATQQKVKTVLNKLDEDLTKLGVTVPKKPHCEMFEKLDDQTKEKVKEIMKQMKEGKITKEEGLAQLKKLGITLPKHHPKVDQFSKLDDNTKAKVKEIFQKVKNGTIAKEEADRQLKALGITLPKNHPSEKIKKLDDATKAKARNLIENAKVEINKLGADFPSRKYNFILR
ncbi:hypothetical protein CW357_14565 [Rummeliibacillus sp. TYF005]|uniref:hypothetical protein n=1 Tax=Rummeliibacillus sp. TYF005 TaxID=2058214 RepID=UPI000F5215BE|nr:hypothetical protein [Rummeliibacillus sp. TYF005]RPJ94604.1 hypothetical protein CW357_14565 [Rummeliibacillus sp. TYF005]